MERDCRSSVCSDTRFHPQQALVWKECQPKERDREETPIQLALKSLIPIKLPEEDLDLGRNSCCCCFQCDQKQINSSFQADIWGRLSLWLSAILSLPLGLSSGEELWRQQNPNSTTS